MQVKNQDAGRSRRLYTLADRCQRRIMLTGTPLQNDLQELHNLLRFLLPSVFRDEPELQDAQVLVPVLGCESQTCHHLGCM